MASREELEAEALTLFRAINLADEVATSALRNAKLRAAVVETIKEAGVADGVDKSRGALIYTVGVKFPPNALVHRKTLLDYITRGDIKSNTQLDGALEFLKGNGTAPLEAAAFEAAAGVGIIVGPEEIKGMVAECMAANEAVLREERYHFNTNILLGQLRSRNKWADPLAVKAELEAQVATLLGPKTEADLAPREKKKKEKKEKKPAAVPGGKGAASAKAGEDAEAWRTADPFAFLPKPSANNMVHTEVHFSDKRVMRIANTPKQLEEHLQRTGGKVRTRFPPEPNGYLHIGHAKAMFIDFGMAAQYGGDCILRFDDTNPEAEKQEYIDHIQDIVGWMGWAPWKVTYSSDYFTQLHALAVELIRRGAAYVCHCSSEEIAAQRERREPSPWRDRPVEESLALFEDMRRGLVDEGKAVLRMKQDHRSDNYNMFDLIAYRIKFTPHPHAGDGWCIYPSYDFTHCLVDSLEDISHSLCTLEFESRRASYYWLLEVLDQYKPLVWEYSRLNITHTVLSKRKLQKLVAGGYVDGWDDPRLLTLAGLRRRGFTPEAINNMCRELGVNRSEGAVHLHKLEHHARCHLDATSRRVLGVLRPLRVVITNLPEGHYEEVEAKFFPGREGEGYKVPFTKVVYIEATDFREEDSKDYYGLAPNKAVMLRYAYPITCTGFSKGADGAVTEVTAEYDARYATSGQKPPKGVMNWVGQPAPSTEPPTFEARLYSHLFHSEDVAALGDAWLDDINPDSKSVVTRCYASPALAAAQPGDRFQLERLGYFCVDPDSSPERGLLLNRTVTLRESSSKTGGKK